MSICSTPDYQHVSVRTTQSHRPGYGAEILVAVLAISMPCLCTVRTSHPTSVRLLLDTATVSTILPRLTVCSLPGIMVCIF